ncbi:periplasmic binding protein, substrate ribose (sugar-binding protein), ABC-type transport system [Escherichia coli]|nr:periplasmic binding protein, substrate ribose (sugar-binding protein), ABC-type transport system [Escherichia coli]
MMNKRFVINMVSSLLLGAALISAPLQAAEKVVVNISKVDGMPWLIAWAKVWLRRVKPLVLMPHRWGLQY